MLNIKSIAQSYTDLWPQVNFMHLDKQTNRYKYTDENINLSERQMINISAAYLNHTMFYKRA